MTADIVTFGETMLRLSPPRGKCLEVARGFDAGIGGAESNVAAAMANLGLDAVWLSKLPDSPLGRRIVRELRSHGVRVGVSWTDEGRVGTYYIEHGGEPRGTTVIYDRDDAAVTTAEPGDLPLSIVRDASMFYTSGITPALSDTLRETTATTLELAAEAGTTTVFDVNYREKLWDPEEARRVYRSLFPAVDVLVVAERDAEQVLGRDGTPVELANGLDAAYDFDTVIVTRGERGALALHDDEIHEQEAFETDTFDPVGTGDAFVGGYLAKRDRGGSVAESLAYGSATAAVKRTLDGDMAILTPEDVANVLETGKTGISR